MANESSSSFFSSFSPQQLLAVLTLLSSTVLLQLQPLQSRREVEVAGKASAAGDDHKFTASHVEDPLAALKAQDVVDPSDPNFDPSRQVQAFTHYGFFTQELRDSVDDARRQKRQVQIICALLRPGNDLIAREQRHRARLAVFSALATLGYAPEAVRRMQVCRLRDIVNDDLQSFTHPWRLGNGTMDVPFEWFKPVGSLPRVAEWRFNRICVLWFDMEEVIGREAMPQPVDRLRQILHALVTGLPAPMSGGRVSAGFDPGLVETAILGPHDSSTLALMIQEGGGQRSLVQRWNQPLRMASPYATSSAQALLQGDTENDCKPPEEELQLKMNKVLDAAGKCGARPGLFLRTPLTDDHVAAALVEELRRRGVVLKKPQNPATQDHASAGDIVLISESDTAYGRMLVRDFLEKAGAGGGIKALGTPEGRWHWTSYPRGLDGSFGAAHPPVFTKVKSGGDGKAQAGDYEPHGTNQMDALRRLAGQLVELHESRQREGRRGIVAVGVLGSDVFDKLLVFRALRPLLKETLFFTNNLDAWLWDDEELGTTRNLIVASPFDLRLGDHWQAGKPPFRDTYQTSVYAATLALVGGDAVKELREQCSFGAQTAARLFEIGRRGPVPLPSMKVEKLPMPLHPTHVATGPAATWRILTTLGGLTVLLTGGWVTWHLASTHRLGRLLLRRQDAPLATPEDMQVQSPARLGLDFLAGHPAAIVAAVVAGWLCSHFLWKLTLEPASITDGVSGCFFFTNSLIAVLIATVLVWRALVILRAGEEQLERSYFKEKREEGSQGQQRWSDGRWRWDAFIPGVLLLWQDKVAADRGSLDPGSLWKSFRLSGWHGPRLVRALCTTAAIGAAIWLLSLLEGPHFMPVRGGLGRLLCGTAGILSVVAFIGLSMVVFDALWLNRIFIDWVGRGRTAWDEEQIRLEKKDGLTERHRCDYTDLLLVADWTRDIGRLTALPFYVLVMLVLARLPWFDAWGWPWSLCAGLVVTAALVILGSYRVHLAALRLQEEALAHLAADVPVLDDGNENVKKLREKVRQISHGAFAPFLKQPVMEALFWFMSALGATGLFQAISQLMA